MNSDRVSLIFLLIICTVFALHLNSLNVEKSNKVTNQTMAIKRVKVLTGHSFDLTLENGKRVYGKLGVKTAGDAKTVVVDFLNNCSFPKVILIDKDDSEWYIKLIATYKTKEVDLEKWLISKGLVFE